MDRGESNEHIPEPTGYLGPSSRIHWSRTWHGAGRVQTPTPRLTTDVPCDTGERVTEASDSFLPHLARLLRVKLVNTCMALKIMLGTW